MRNFKWLSIQKKTISELQLSPNNLNLINIVEDTVVFLLLKCLFLWFSLSFASSVTWNYTHSPFKTKDNSDNN